MTELAILPDGFEPPASWRRIALRGGSHDGTICWAQTPPRRLRMVHGGDEYVQVREGLYRWHDPERPAPAPEAESAEPPQMELA